MRLVGQVHDITVSLPGEPLAPGDPRRREGRPSRASTAASTPTSTRARVIEAISWRVQCAGTGARDRRRAATASASPPARPSRAPAGLLRRRRGWSRRPSTTATRCGRARRIAGPAIVEEREATTVVPPGDRLEVDAQRNLRLLIGSAPRPSRPPRSPARPRRRWRCIEADPIGLEIMWSRLINLVEEMLAHRVAHGLLADHRRGAGLRLRDPRRAGQLAGPLPARHAGLQPHPAARGAGHAREVPRRDAPARRRPDHQRSVDVRRPPVRHRHRDSGVPRGPGGRR